MVVRVAGQYHRHGLDFCIITFYDPQRAAVIEALKKADLPSERVHNVDSFQGKCHSWSSRSPRLDSLILFVRERGRLCDPFFRSDKAAWFFEITASHERRIDPLPQRNGSRHRQELFTGQREEYAPREALQHLVKTPQRLLERLECRAKQLSRAPWTTSAILTVEWRARHDTTTQPAGSGSDPVHVCRISLRQRQRDWTRGLYEDSGSTKRHSSIVSKCTESLFSTPQQEGSEMSQQD